MISYPSSIPALKLLLENSSLEGTKLSEVNQIEKDKCCLGEDVTVTVFRGYMT